jgi:hypothetical protein
MKISHIAAVVLLGLGSLPALAQIRVIELTHEAVPSQLTLPRAADGELTLQLCATCKVLRLRASASTRYLIGREEVTLADVTRYLGQHRMATVVVVQPKDEFSLSRMVVATVGAK